MMRLRQGLSVLLTGTSLLLGAVPSWSAPQPGAPAADADAAMAEQFAKAQELFRGKDFVNALPLFREVLASSGSPNARLYVARCLKKIGKVAEAYDEMARTVREATERAHTEPKYEPTRNAAAAQLAMLDPLVAQLVVAVADAPPGLEIVVNGQPLAPAQAGKPVTIEIGATTIEATAPGKKRAQRRLDVPGGEITTITLTLEDEPQGEAVPAPAPVAEPSGGAVQIAGIVVAGLGVGGMVLFGITGAMAQGKLDTLEEECGGVRCTDPAQADTVDEGTTLMTVANVSLAVGATALVAGTFMMIFGGPSEPEAVSLQVGPTGGSLRVRF